MRCGLVAAALALAGAAGLLGQDDEPLPEVCGACHEDLVKAFLASPHNAISGKKGWENQACAACHGAGLKHAESADPKLIRNPRHATLAGAEASCTVCHVQTKRTTSHVMNSHTRHQVGCLTCHSVHGGAEGLVARRAATVNRQCTACHVAEKASFLQPHGHPVARDSMSCTDCHAPHGSTLARAVRTISSNDTGCLKCHGDKRGPFTFEHAPMRIEGCSSCHVPHGSANPHLLTRHEVRFQCLECHGNLAAGAIGSAAPAFHDLRSPRYRNCTTCHVKIHGSHVNRAFLR